MGDSLLNVPCASKRLSEAQPCTISLVIIDAAVIIYFLVAPGHVESSWTRDQTHVLCIGRQILNHWNTREVQNVTFLIDI